MKIPQRIGFIGLGIMGKEILKNLIKVGYKPAIYNRTLSKCIEFEKYGCTITPTPSLMAEVSNIIIVIVENDEALSNVIEGPYGLFKKMKNGSYLINMSTISVEFSKYIHAQCTKRGIKFIDSPILGSKKQAQLKELIILTSGNKDEIEKFKELFNSIGKDLIYVGDIPTSTVLKLSINLILASMTTAIVESTTLAESYGIDSKTVFDILKKSPVLDCGFFRGKESNIINNDFTTSFSIKNILKDTKYMIKASEDKNKKLHVLNEISKVFEKAKLNGYSDEDITAIKKLY